MLLRKAFALALRFALLCFLGIALRLPALHFLCEYLVVDTALFSVGEDRVGFANFLERRIGLGFSAGVAVGMPLHCGAAVSALDFVQGGVRLHAEGRVDGRHVRCGGCRGKVILAWVRVHADRPPTCVTTRC